MTSGVLCCRHSRLYAKTPSNLGGAFSCKAHKRRIRVIRRVLLLLLLVTDLALGQAEVPPGKEASLKADVSAHIDSMKKQAQVMVDTVFSFGELGFQEFETSKYLTSILEKEG